MVALKTFLAALVGYLLGSISFSIIFTWLFTRKDVRDYGSGNAGATNVFRAVGVWPGILTFVFDLSKGAAAIILGRFIFEAFAKAGVGMADAMATRQIGMCIAGLFAVLGHLYPLYFNFRGGKGVLTVAGIILMLSWQSFVVLFFVCAIALALSRTVSIASCAAAAAYPIVTLALVLIEHSRNPALYTGSYCAMMTVVSVIFGALVIFMHRSNIRRIIDGTEPKLSIKTGEKKKKAEC